MTKLYVVAMYDEGYLIESDTTPDFNNVKEMIEEEMAILKPTITSSDKTVLDDVLNTTSPIHFTTWTESESNDDDYEEVPLYCTITVNNNDKSPFSFVFLSHLDKSQTGQPYTSLIVKEIAMW